MSVLLKGLKMPKGNNFVTIHVSGNGKWCDVWETELEGEVVEVPTPHGRLIDADAHKETLNDNLRPMEPIIAPDGSRWFQDIDKQGWTEGK